MGNCFITKLDGIANNATIEKLGVLKINADQAVNRFIEFSASELNVCKLKLHGVVLQIGSITFNDEVNIPTNDYGLTVVSCEPGGYIELVNKYDFTSIIITRLAPQFDTAKLKSCTKLRKVGLAFTAIYGNISDFQYMSDLSSLALSDTNIVGDVTAFLDNIATLKNNGDTLTIYVSSQCSNVPQGIGTSYATRGIVTFDGNGGYTISNP